MSVHLLGISLLKKLHLGNEKYPALTGIRFLGATVVFFDHLPLLPGAHVVVNVMAFFYVLSGFLIVRIYYEQAELRREWLAQYFLNRFARIYPVYFLLLTVAVLLHHDFRPGMLLANYTLTHAFFHSSTLLIQASWSLTVEETFYLLAPLFMLLGRRYQFLVPLALGWLLLGMALAVSTLGWRFLGTPIFVLSTTFFGHFLEFFAGFYLALSIMKIERRGSLHKPGARRTWWGFGAVLVPGVASVLLYRQTPLNFYAIFLVNNFLLPIPIALLYYGLIRERTAVSSALATKTCALLGRASYSFYLLQGLIVPFLRPLAESPAGMSRMASVLGAFGVLWVLAILLFLGYEEPLNRLIRDRFRTQQRWVGMPATLFRP